MKIELKLPELKLEQKVGNLSTKNEILHLVSPSQEINGNLISVKPTNFEVQDEDGIKYLLTSDKHFIPENKQYILLCDKYSQQDFSNQKIQIKDWLRHPSEKEFKPSQIINTWENTFNFKKENQAEKILGLREPQLGAIHSLLGHLTSAKDIATVVLPTGTGKTETMLSILVANKCNKLLVTVPSDALRTQLADKFYNLGLLKVKDKDGNSILDPKAEYPIVGIMNTGFKNIKELRNFFERCNVYYYNYAPYRS